MSSDLTEGKNPPGAWPIVAGQAVIGLVGLYALVGSVSLGLWSSMGPGAGFFPAVLGAFLVVLAIVWFIQERSVPQEQGAAESFDRTQIIAVVASLVVLAAALPFLGFQLSMLAFLMYHLNFRARIGWIRAIVISLCGSFGVFYLFTKVLHVSLPVASIPPLNLIGL
ncbi:tripartite tricarboxylate transporter TctB family protein [Glutamicibacter nicotianae]|uniref:tripartite tricarboxylate transporter TctB family protein n=1 Tax=Glutamicibacter nicotianae TaxID=37929 RepID=UPI0025548C2D|nr:tripartite tricarboxylate transporter TctB family protein [Glutamicibacter nicotianae]WIV44187.1 tripartite tricarboxylate transporter TctB family protein [Glutamicibacter nicotianae]